MGKIVKARHSEGRVMVRGIWCRKEGKKEGKEGKLLDQYLTWC